MTVLPPKSWVKVNYRPKRSFGQGNIFTPVCHSFCSQGGYLTSRTPPGPGPPAPREQQTPEYGQRSAGTHPTGMHSCFIMSFDQWETNFGNIKFGISYVLYCIEWIISCGNSTSTTNIIKPLDNFCLFGCLEDHLLFRLKSPWSSMTIKEECYYVKCLTFLSIIWTKFHHNLRLRNLIQVLVVGWKHETSCTFIFLIDHISYKNFGYISTGYFPL